MCKKMHDMLKHAQHKYNNLSILRYHSIIASLGIIFEKYVPLCTYNILCIYLKLKFW